MSHSRGLSDGEYERQQRVHDEIEARIAGAKEKPLKLRKRPRQTLLSRLSKRIRNPNYDPPNYRPAFSCR